MLQLDKGLMRLVEKGGIFEIMPMPFWSWVYSFFKKKQSVSPAKPKRKRRANGVNVRIAVTLPAVLVEEIQKTAEDSGLPVSVVVEMWLKEHQERSL